MTTTGERVKELREKRGWTVARLARESGLSHAGISKIENGVEPRMSTFKALANTFGVDVSELTTVATEQEIEDRPTLANLSALLVKMGLSPADREMVLRFVEGLLVMTEDDLKAEAARQLKADNPAMDRFERPAKKQTKRPSKK